MNRTLLVAAGVHALDGARAVRALLLDGDRLVWTGGNPADAPAADATVDLGGAWVTPSFVDAHVHATATGLTRIGVDLVGSASSADVVDRVRRRAADTVGVVYGSGWDDFAWPLRRPPTADELSVAAPGRTVLLLRVDGHSCLVDRGTLERLPLERLEGVARDPDGQPTGWLLEAASEAAQTLVREEFSAQQLHAARLATCAAALELGIGSFHEMGHPGLAGLEDALAWAGGQWPLDVHTWWAELDLDKARNSGLRPGGDLFLDGSIGSQTAATTKPYGSDGGCGVLFHDDADVVEWFSACTAAGIGAGVHAIGDRAIEQALAALETAAGRHGSAAVRDCRHRIEHVELPTRGQVERMAGLGIVASVQPAFDAVWGGDEGLYAEQFGVQAARASNPLSWFADAGVALAFGSDSTVTPLDPWGGVAAAIGHRGGLGLTPLGALAAHSTGGRRVAGQDDVGPLTVGARADLAVWDVDPLASGGRGRRKSLATVVAGTVRHGDLELARS